MLFLVHQITVSMEVILDELTPLEFFKHGGIVKVTVNDEDLVKICKKKKLTFFDYKSYVRFLRSLYITKEYEPGRFEKVNKGLSLKSSIGTSEYVTDLKYDNIHTLEAARFYYTRDMSEPEVNARDPYGIPNVCFSKIKDTDDRWEEYTKQRLERGFDNSELWNLDSTIAKFIYPRLEAFYEDAKAGSYRPDGMNREEWLQILERMVNGFYLISLDRIKSEEEEAVADDGLKLFSQYFYTLWN